MMKECKIVRDLMPNYIDGLTSKESNEYIEKHLETCNDCTTYLNEMKSNVELKSKGIICTAVCPGWIDTDMLSKEYKGKSVKFPGLVSPNRVAVQSLRDSAKGKDMSVCTLFVKYEHLLSKVLPQKVLMKIWMYGIRDYV